MARKKTATPKKKTPKKAKTKKIAAKVPAKRMTKKPDGDGTKARVSLSAVLLEVNRRVLGSLDLETILGEVGEVTQKLLGADDVSLLLVDPHGKELVEHMIVSRRRAPDNRYRIRIRQEGITGWVAENRKPQVVADVRKDKRYVPTSDKIRSEAAVPVMAGDRLLGVLNAESAKVGRFSTNDLKLLELLASQVAIALENAETHDLERNRGRQLQILHHLARMSDGSLPNDAVLQRAVDAVRREFSCHFAAVMLGDMKNEELVVLAQSVTGEPTTKVGGRQKFGSGLIGTAFKIGETLNVRDVSRDPVYLAEIENTQSELCVPIRIGARCIGIIDVQSRQLDAFATDDVVFLETIACFLIPVVQAMSKSRLVKSSR
jgi:sigma-B regulation protein RsbU (phosphoserine phosphatase)